MAYPYMQHPQIADARTSVRDVIDNEDANLDNTNMAAIRAAAEKFVGRFGDHASREAAARAAESLEAHKYQARVRWQLIGNEVEKFFVEKEID